MKQIRLMTTLDLDAVLAIERLCSVDPWSQAIFLACIERHQCFVVTLDREVIGFAVMMINDTEAQILNIGITPKYQHMGFGKYLMAELIDSARLDRATEVLLEVRCSNLPAQALYQKFGFVVIGHRKDYYLTLDGREDAYVMLLNLW